MDVWPTYRLRGLIAVGLPNLKLSSDTVEGECVIEQAAARGACSLMIELGGVDTKGLLREAESRFMLGTKSVHGPFHWRAVFVNGMALAQQLPCDRSLVAVFALLHDCRRENEWDDPRHGARAADVAREINGRFFYFEPDRLTRLTEALHWHDAGKVHTDLDISCCWAADRIELRRVGIEPAQWGFCDITWPIASRILSSRRGENVATA